MAPSRIEISTIAARAASIYERAAVFTSDATPAGSVPNPAAAHAIESWNQAFSPGDRAAFLRRLTWDGLDLQTVLAAASEADTTPVDRSWTIWLERACAAAYVVADEVASDRFVADPDLDVPFEEIWTALRRAAALAIDLTPDWPEWIGAEALASLERQLCVELTRQGALALFELYRGSDEFQQLAEPLRPDARYRRFVMRLLGEGLVPLFNEYPALARSLVSITSDWVDATRDFLQRLRGDRQVIAATFGGDPGPAMAIEPGLSDPHQGRRRVASVQFRSGLRLVYKPREVALERAFNDFLRWISPHLEVPLTALTVLDRGAYGWVEFAAHGSMPDAAAAARSLRQSGSLMCIAHVLGAQDLHMENLIVTTDGPVLVDTEMLLQPISRKERSGTDEPDADEVSTGSALETGMLSLVTVTDTGDVYDSGGMRGQISGPLPFPHRVWHERQSDAIHFTEEPSFRSAGRHQTRVGDAVLDPADGAPMLLEGFADAYRCLLSRRDELASPSGPLRACAAGAARVTLRPTNQYAMLSFVLAAPKYQRSGVARSTAVDVLNRPFAGHETRPSLWAAVVEERRAIARLDVPYFSVRVDGTDLLGEGRVVVADYFARSGLEAALARVHRLSERDLDRQIRGLQLALGESCTSRYAAAPPSAASPVDRAIEFARAIGHELLRRADRTGGALEWRYQLTSESGFDAHYLYQGSLGPVVLFAALAATTGDPQWRDHATAALLPLRRTIGSAQLPRNESAPNIGGAAGLGSIVYGLTVAGSLLKDAAMIDLAGDVANTLPAYIDSDDRFDVIDGAAGAALALLAHAGTTQRRDILQQAIACGDHLIRHRELVGDSAAWRSPAGVRLVGFAHGTAGIAAVMCRLFRITGERRFGDAARLACRFVEAQFVERSGNYPIVAAAPGAPRGAMLAWCHGAPGIMLGLCRELDILSKTAILAQFETALRAVARDLPAQVDHLCCGAFGRIDAMITAARAWGRADLERAAWQLADDVGRRAIARGHFRLSGSGVDYRVYDPGFFRGLSGIGYQWLRLANPALPSVASFDPVPQQ